jgi:leucyl aminopeptidase
MLGYNPEGHKDVLGLVTDFTDPEHNQFMKQLIADYAQLKVQDMKCEYACSDHSSWNLQKFTSSFVFETPGLKVMNPNIHSERIQLSILTLKRLLNSQGWE